MQMYFLIIVMFSGFVLENNKFIGKNIIEKVMNLCPNDLKLAHKLTESHINVPSSKKQNVRLAAQLFSNSVAKSISYCGQKYNLGYNNWQEVIHNYILNIYEIFFSNIVYIGTKHQAFIRILK